MAAFSASLVRAPLALFGLPSIRSLVESFFQDFARAFVPDFLKNASIATIKWLVAVPDPTVWRHVGQLEGDMSYLAFSLLAVSFTAAIVRYLLVGLTGTGHPLQALSSTVTSAGLLVAYPWGSHQVVAIVNTLTNAVLSFPVVGAGLQRTVGVLFGSALLVGSGGVFVALLVIVGVTFAAIMFALKVLLLLAFALLYAVGPLVISVRPLPELAHLSRAWATALLGVALVPVGWTILFAVAGALSLDATSFGSTHTGTIGGALTAHIAGVFAALLTFYLALKLPLGVLSHLRGAIPGLGSGGGSAGAGAGVGGGGGFQRVADAHARLRSGTLAAGRAAGLAAGALGAPAGGPLGAAGRVASRLSSPLASSALAAGGAVGGAALAAGGGLASRVGALRGRLSRGGGGGEDGTASRSQTAGKRPGRTGGALADPSAGTPDGPRAGARVKGDGASARLGSDVGGQQRPADAGGSGSASPPRPPQRAAPAGEGNTRASSATGRGGSSDPTDPSRRSVDGPNTHRTRTHVTRGGGSSRDDGLAADASARRDTSRPAKPKPPRAEPTPGGNPPSGTRSGNPQRGERGKASPPPPRTNPPRGPRGGRKG